ncbi:c-type cytochrome [Microbulbifer marinus]|uniref:Cytochrome c553 n=1 Tax=Microbulbifer marinus TaxID=658218 RepID=A0A1H4B0C5_9GAMM|nr:cytochrome c [Microbulbifer marinus]SEA41625.1 Cytochrome c553 [Microbulbifer marinus]
MRWSIALIALLASTAVFAAGDPAAGKEKAALCASCHGADGISPNDLWPNLAGQKAGYLVKQMKAFRDGTRNDPMMAPMAKNLSDEDIADLAAYYASLK